MATELFRIFISSWVHFRKLYFLGSYFIHILKYIGIISIFIYICIHNTNTYVDLNTYIPIHNIHWLFCNLCYFCGYVFLWISDEFWWFPFFLINLTNDFCIRLFSKTTVSFLTSPWYCPYFLFHQFLFSSVVLPLHYLRLFWCYFFLTWVVCLINFRPFWLSNVNN